MAKRPPGRTTTLQSAAPNRHVTDKSPLREKKIKKK